MSHTEEKTKQKPSDKIPALLLVLIAALKLCAAEHRPSDNSGTGRFTRRFIEKADRLEQKYQKYMAQ